MTVTLLRVDALRLEGGEGVILDGLSLSVAAGEIVGLRGVNGAGKSMLLASIAGLPPRGVRRTAGRIEVSGGRVGWAMQDATDALDPWRRISAELRVTLGAHRRPRDPRPWLDAIGLTRSQAARRPAGLSGGQRQRAVLAMAMCSEPLLLLADEPTASLDAAARDRIGALLRRAADQGNCGVLLVSHDAAFLTETADRIVTLADGTARETARPNVSPAATTGGEALLSLRDVSFALGGTRLLEAISLDVPSGRTLALVGPSGSGKTTIACLAAGLFTPTAGQVVRRGPVAMVFQDAYGCLDPFWSVGRSIAEPLSPRLSRAQRRREVTRHLADVGLPEAFADMRPSRLSGGQRQRVAIARALAARPALLICDEPTSALDPRTRGAILELLRTAQARDGFGMLLASHDEQTVRALAHEICRIEHGRLVPASAAG